MRPTVPSHTALRVALRRAAHQLYDKPLVFKDPLAVPILGERYSEELRRTPTRTDRPFSVAQRAYLVARSRYAEDNLQQAVARGVRQYVLLGAGLDTFGYRNPHPGLRVFEVDHPATQQWKRELLQHNRIAIPESVAYVPVDFEQTSLAAQLANEGFNHQAPTLFAWLGVIAYLTPEAFRATLAFVADQPRGTGLVLDYRQPHVALPPVEQWMHASLAARVEKAGEPFRLLLDQEQMAARLTHFDCLEDLGAEEINYRYFKGRNDQLQMLGHAIRFACGWFTQ